MRHHWLHRFSALYPLQRLPLRHYSVARAEIAAAFQSMPDPTDIQQSLLLPAYLTLVICTNRPILNRTGSRMITHSQLTREHPQETLRFVNRRNTKVRKAAGQDPMQLLHGWTGTDLLQRMMSKPAALCMRLSLLHSTTEEQAVVYRLYMHGEQTLKSGGIRSF